ncbi:agrin isoform X1 [Agrilus planipennis]|uniref:Agrin isoform X1 n=1 Tax=Agrilus planipennis TaxID=224129 RepID=A0A1W4XLX9_AGRPL|nr:agrin isoform X1 [Agrilus planipennis]
MMYSGKCTTDENPCEELECKHYRECSIDKRGHATCVCPPPCEMKMKPVCGNDDRTYSSLCELKRTACTFNLTLEPAYQGVCGEMGPCSHHVCRFGAVCQEKNGIAACQCFTCSSEFQPVCGSDGITYGNICKLKLESCKQQQEIRVMYTAPCDGCESRKCDFYSMCVPNEDIGTQCVCPTSCTDAKLLKGPVCGNDGVTYVNECEMRMISCKTQQLISVSYRGPCNSCNGEECPIDGDDCKSGNCQCPVKCEGVREEPVCASSNKTFINECEFQKANCERSPDLLPLTILFYGNCSERFTAASTLTPYSSVGVDSKLGNIEFSHTKRLSYNNTELDLETAEKCRDIICDFDATCEIGPDNFPRCTCQFDCENIASEQSVCASDKKMYPTLCAMKMEACQRQQELRLRPLEVCKGSEVKPCNGEKPVVDPFTNEEFDCGNNANRRDCPTGSYCHITLTVARCCPIEVKKESNSCKDSWYGCCPDEKTPAQGPNNAGCPSVCRCNRLGSYSKSCDPTTLQCPCKPGVGGQKCDSCLPGFWGLQHIDKGSVGCIPCACSAFGSVRVDCEQMTGRCVCKPGVQGNKCTFCSNPDKVLGPNGCVPDVAAPPPTTCKELTCHFGASCVEQGGTAFCDCYNECNEKTDNQIVCGSDDQTYTSSCQLQLLACRLQKDIVVQAFGPCKDDTLPGTELPFRRYTPLQFTQSDESNSPLSKSTRHLMVPDLKVYYERAGSYIPPRSSYPDTQYISNSASIGNDLYPSSGTGIFESRGEHIAAAYRPTPATVRVITALLGDLCSNDSDCLILHSSCVGGACTCLPGYAESSDRQACNEASTTEEFRACFSSPCAEGSRCVDLPAASFACICSVNFTGQLCDIPISKTNFDVPSFDGQAYIRLKPLKAYYKLSIEIEFKAYTNNGILLYNQQRENGQGDFVSIAVVNGFIEFRYNLGNGPTVIKSLDKIQLNRYHTVVVKRYRRDGFLKLNEDESIVGQSKGTWEALDLAEETFVGNVITTYKKVYENIGTNQGLRGCIRRLKIGRRGVKLNGDVDDFVLGVQGIQECGSDPCSGSPCQNDGICQAVDSELYRCECGPSFIGDFCENVIDPCLSNPCKGGSECFSLDTENFMCQCPAGRKGRTCDLVDTNWSVKIPEFNGSSYLKLPTLKGVMKTFSLEVVFLSKSLNGLILYNGQKKKNKGDFISVNLVGGFVQFRFNLGSGIANITSSKPIEINKWHRLRVLRDGREGFLQLDDSSIEKGWSGASLTDLNLELPFFIGSVESWREIHRLSEANKGFKGALQRLVVNGESIPISANFPECSSLPENITTCSSGVGLYDGPPCVSSKTPCHNNGLCIPNLDDYICKCPPSFEGKHCQIAKEEGISVKFTGETFLQYRNRGYKNETFYDYEEDYAEQEYLEVLEDYELDFGYEPTESYSDFDFPWKKAERGNKYIFKLRTFASDGLLLWRSKTRSIQEDYFSVAIVNGYPELSYNLGKQKAFWAIRTKRRIDDGEWHTLEVRRRKKMGFISVDHETPAKGVSNNGALTLSTNSKLWIGGMPSLPPGLPSAYYKGFEGCVKHVSISSRPLNLLKHISPKKIEFCHDNEI